jgi:antitoxin ParD1/3/4/toxin ParE1/3/4
MSRYLLTETAEEELRGILGFIAEESGQARALHVLDALESAFEALAAAPGIGHHRSQLTGTTLRWWPVFRFQVLYDPESRPLTVLRILHGSRDLDRIFGHPEASG